MKATMFQYSDVAPAPHVPERHQPSKLAHIFRTWCQRAVSRQELAKLDERLLQDLGISEQAREAEVSKPFWRA